MSNAIIELEKTIALHIAEAGRLLVNLPADITFVLDEGLIIDGNGTGGTLIQPTVLGIGYYFKFEDKKKLAKNLRATVLHECYHAVQGWSDEKPTLVPSSLLEDGVLEGAATVFEREFGETSPLWSSYENEKVMRSWLTEIRAQLLDPNSEEYFVYKFGTVNGTRWMLYKLGTWIVDNALSRNPHLLITDIASKTPSEIIELAGI